MSTILYESYYGVETLGSPYLAHYQVKGAKHGVRRYQNKDGSLTPLGREHYSVGPPREKSKGDNVALRAAKATGKAITGTGRGVAKVAKGVRKAYKDFRKEHAKNAALSGNIKSVLRNRKYMDAATYAAAIDRIDKTIKLNELRATDTSKTFKRFEKAVNIFKKTVDVVDTGRNAYRKLRERDKDPNVLAEYKKYIVDVAKKAADEARKNGGEGSAFKAYAKTVADGNLAIEKLWKDTKKGSKEAKEEIKAIREAMREEANSESVKGQNDTINKSSESKSETQRELTSEQKKLLSQHIEAFNKHLKEEKEKEEKEEKKKKK